MKLFTPGPVNISEDVLRIGGEQQPYFRTEEFSKINIENEKIILELINAEKAKFIPLTASGTGAMDAVVANLVTNDDKVLIINGGSFGERWVEICEFYGFNYIDYTVEFGKNINLKEFEKTVTDENITVILAQGTETSSGQAHPIKKIGEIIKNRDILFVVDAITAFLADEYKMDDWNIDVTVMSSQKGFALPLGMAYIVMNEKAIEKCKKIKSKSFYFDLKVYLSNLERGQTPFSPAITLIKQFNFQVKKIKEIGINNHLDKIKYLANDFRNRIKDLPVELIAENPSNCITTLRIRETSSGNAFELFTILKNNYEIYINPTGGKQSSSDFRVSHLGELTENDNKYLVELLTEYFNKH